MNIANFIYEKMIGGIMSWLEKLSPTIWTYMILGVVVAPIVLLPTVYGSLLIVETDLRLLIEATLLVLSLVGFVGIALIFLFPIMVYKDTKNVLGTDSEWHPFPLLYALGGVFGYFIPLLQQVVGIIYLYKRYKSSRIPQPTSVR